MIKPIENVWVVVDSKNMIRNYENKISTFSRKGAAISYRDYLNDNYYHKYKPFTVKQVNINFTEVE